MDGFGLTDQTNGDGFANVAAAAATDFDHALMSSFFTPGMSLNSLHEAQSMLHFKNGAFGSTGSAHFPIHQEQLGFGIEDMISDNEYSDDSTSPAADGSGTEKPRNNGCRKRLSVHQVHCLEKCFKVDSKLEPRRKSELAREVGLKPRQVAIWFQNRRARHKNKQIEKDYDKIAAQYGLIKAQYDKAINENKKLKDQIKCLNEEMSLMKDSLLNCTKLFQAAGLLDAHMMQPQAMQTQAEPQVMQHLQPELQHAYDNPNDFNNACNGAINEQQAQVQQRVISPANSVFDSSSHVVKPNSSKLLGTPMAISYPGGGPAEKRGKNYMQCEQENSVNQELHYDLPNLFDLEEPNSAAYSSQVNCPPIIPCSFGVIPSVDDPFWQLEILSSKSHI